MDRNKKYYLLLGFTMLELLIVIGIIAILAAVVVVAINPGEHFRQTKDTKRIQELTALNDAVLRASLNSLNLGAAKTVYVSIPDNNSSSCASLGLPALSAGWQYHCVSDANLKKTNGTGWMPVDFDQSGENSPLAVLPTDPMNSVSSGNLYYAYATTGTAWVLTTAFESSKYVQNYALNDGGSDPNRYEIGIYIKLWADATL